MAEDGATYEVRLIIVQVNEEKTEAVMVDEELIEECGTLQEAFEAVTGILGL